MMNEKQSEQVMLSQGKAISIEWIMRRGTDCDQLGFGGQVSADHIRKHPFLSMTQGISCALRKIRKKGYYQQIHRRFQFLRKYVYRLPFII